MIQIKNKIKEKLASHVKSAHNIDMSTLVIGYSELIHHLFNPATGEDVSQLIPASIIKMAKVYE
mgnify:CR=1 FL=1